MCRARIVIVIVGLAAIFEAGAAAGQDQQRIAPFVKPVQVHPGLPPLAVRVVPGPPSETDGTAHQIGRIEISRGGEPKPFQTLTVTGSASRYLTFSRFEDANFDGYADLLLGNDGGAKWGGYEIHFYDPASGQFIENDLSREMSRRLRGNNLVFHPDTARIELDYLESGSQGPVVETFVLEGSHLRRVGQATGVKLRRNM
jgi:hypothetical protein